MNLTLFIEFLFLNFQNNIVYYGQYVGICSLPNKFEDIKALGGNQNTKKLEIEQHKPHKKAWVNSDA